MSSSSVHILHTGLVDDWITKILNLGRCHYLPYGLLLSLPDRKCSWILSIMFLGVLVTSCLPYGLLWPLMHLDFWIRSRKWIEQVWLHWQWYASWEFAKQGVKLWELAIISKEAVIIICKMSSNYDTNPLGYNICDLSTLKSSLSWSACVNFIFNNLLFF